MSKGNNLTDLLTDIADAIRAKKDIEGKINPQNFSSEIESIETAIPINNQDKSIDIAENGSVEIVADPAFTGLGKVSVKVAIPNEEKTVDITKNGTTEVVADNGFLSKVIVNTNVTSGGGDGSDMPIIGDGKTYLYIKIAEKGRMDVPLYFSQTVTNGVTIDWGDGSATQTLSGTGNKNPTHTYANKGDYAISLEVADGCTLSLGCGSSSYCIMGSTGNAGKVYCNMLQAVEIGKNVTSIGSYAFYSCYSLASIVIPEGVTSIGSGVFSYCYSLASVVISKGVTSIGNYTFEQCNSLTSVVIPEGVTSIGSYAFNKCYSLTSIVIPGDITSIGSCAFENCNGMPCYDFRNLTSVPKLSSTSAFSSIPSDCKIVVPDSLYDTWIAATNWSTYASYIIKASEFNG